MQVKKKKKKLKPKRSELVAIRKFADCGLKACRVEEDPEVLVVESNFLGQGAKQDKPEPISFFYFHPRLSKQFVMAIPLSRFGVSMSKDIVKILDNVGISVNEYSLFEMSKDDIKLRAARILQAAVILDGMRRFATEVEKYVRVPSTEER